jgi:hypothetical protein
LIYQVERLAEFEVVFEMNGSSCVRIIPMDDPLWFKKQDTTYKFNLAIKDPSFMNQENERFLFYFSKVYIRPLIHCTINNTESVCAATKLQSDKVDVGIEYAKTAKMPPVRTLEPGFYYLMVYFKSC